MATETDKKISAGILVTEIPSSLKQLARLVVRGFYTLEEALVVDLLVFYSCLREEDMGELLKFDKKMLRAKIASLKRDKFIQEKQRIETSDEGTSIKMNCYFINYKVFVNVVKYKLDHIMKKMETSERDATNRASFRCTSCPKTFTDLEADQLFDPFSMGFKCTFCSSAVEEDDSAGPKSDSRNLLVTFNEQMDELFRLLREVEGIRLAPGILEPDPSDVNIRGKDGTITTRQQEQRTEMRNAMGEMGGKWTDEASRTRGGFGDDSQNIKIDFSDTKKDDSTKARVQPVWMTDSTVKIDQEEDSNMSFGDSAGISAASLVNIASAVEGSSSSGQPAEQDEEIINLLLKHETKKKSKSDLAFGKGLKLNRDSDSDDDAGSDDSAADEPEQPDVDEFGNPRIPKANEVGGSSGVGTSSDIQGLLGGMEGGSNDVEEMEDDDDDDDDGDIPTIRVGDEEITVTDVNEEIIARMTTEEKERYSQIYQDFYSHMYE